MTMTTTTFLTPPAMRRLVAVDRTKGKVIITRLLFEYIIRLVGKAIRRDEEASILVV